MSQSQDHSGFSRVLLWEHKRLRAPRQMIHTLHTVYVHMNGHSRPVPCEAKWVCGFQQVLEAAACRCRVTWIREWPHTPPLLQKKIKISSCLMILHLPVLLFPVLAVLVSISRLLTTKPHQQYDWYQAQSLDLFYYPASQFPLFPSFFPQHA